MSRPVCWDQWRRALDGAPFKPRVAKGDWGEKPPSTDTRVDDRRLWGAFIFALNDPVLFRTVEQIAGCGRIGSFFGSVYRTVPGQGHFHSWHNDMDDSRLVAVSINLSLEKYSGGVLQIADAGSETPLSEVVNTGFGDAVLFEVSERLEHRVTEVERGPAKTALAGWFRRVPEVSQWLKVPAVDRGWSSGG